MVDGKELKSRYHALAKECRDSGNSNIVYSFEMLRVLKEMAMEDIYPDGSFGDDDCNVWEMFRV